MTDRRIAVLQLGDALRRRMLVSYLAILLLLYASAVVVAYAFEAAPADVRGEFAATALCAAGIAVAATPAPMPRWRYLFALICAVAAPAAALLFHELLAAQAWSVVPLMFVAVYLRMWHQREVARPAAVAIAGVAVVALLVAPAPVPPLWLLLYVACIVGGAEVVGMMSAALIDAALRDPLTTVWNRAGLEREAGRLIGQARRRLEPVAVVVLDVDDFKGVNDRDGHTAGDAVLVRLTGHWLTVLPPEGVIGRIGGDEFVIILRGHPEDQARMVAGRLVAGHAVRVTYGVAVGPADAVSFADLYEAADADLYRNKHSRRGSADRGDRLTPET